MARSKRLHMPGGLHYLILRGNAGRQVFPQSSDFSEFAALVSRHLQACHIRLLAFCWVANAAYFALQVSDVPLGHFVQRIAGQHAQHVNRRAGVRGHLFRQRYRAVAVPESQLPSIVSHLHLLPLRLGLTADPAGYTWSSHRNYAGLQTLSWVTTEPVLRLLERPGRSGIEAYRQFIRDESDRGTGPAARDTPAGDEERAFFTRLKQARHRAGRDPGALDHLVDSIAARLNVRPDELQSPSRRRILSLGRAAVAWHATHAGIARLNEVAHRLNRQSSTLSLGMERYRQRRPDLFEELLGSGLTRSASES